jgi:hypothetical protein
MKTISGVSRRAYIESAAATLSLLAASDRSVDPGSVIGIRAVEPDPAREAERERRKQAKAAAKQKQREIDEMNAGRPLTRQQRRRMGKPWKRAGQMSDNHEQEER